MGAAIKQLEGLGLAPQDEKLARQLQKNLSPLKEPLPEGLISETLQVTLQDVKKALFQACSAGSDSSDVFLFKTDHLHHVRGTKFFSLLAQYIHRLISPDVPRQVAVVEKSGSIFASNKVSEAAQSFLRDNDQDYKIRAITVPGLPLRIGLSVVVDSKQADKVKKSLQDENVSLGKRHGAEMIAKAAQGAVRSNSFLILVRDGENAFLNIK